MPHVSLQSYPFLFSFKELTYSTITPVTPSPRSKLLGVTNSSINATCLNNSTRSPLTKKVEFNLRFLPMISANLKASDSLLRHLRCPLQR
jgi:hypothetical protein